MRCLWDCQIGEEEEVEQCVDKLFCERLCILPLIDWRPVLSIFTAVKQNLVGNG